MLLLDDSRNARIKLQKRAFLFSWITVLILFIFQPFGTFESAQHYKYLRLSGYGLSTFFAIFTAGFIEIELSKHRHKISYYPQLIFSLYIVIAAVFNHSYFVLAIFNHWYWQNQIMFVFYVIAIAAFPLTIMYFHESRIKPPIKEIKTPRHEIAQENDNNLNALSPLVTLFGENKSDILTVPLNDIIAMKSADNYCEIILNKQGLVTRELLRLSLTKVLGQLPSNDVVMRCHRSYGVNVSHVKTSSGNANGLQLIMKFDELTIPVSRSYVERIKQAL